MKENEPTNPSPFKNTKLPAYADNVFLFIFPGIVTHTPSAESQYPMLDIRFHYFCRNFGCDCGNSALFHATLTRANMEFVLTNLFEFFGEFKMAPSGMFYEPFQEFWTNEFNKYLTKES